MPDLFRNQWLNILVMDLAGRRLANSEFEPYETRHRARFWCHAVETLERLGVAGTAAVMLAIVGRKHKRVYEIANTLACGDAAPAEAGA